MRVFFFVFFFSFFLFLDRSVAASYQGLPLSQARFVLEKKLSQDYSHTIRSQLKKSESLVALIYLERLAGREQKARKLFAFCNSFCMDILLKKEWKALLAWACTEKFLKTIAFCS